MTLDNSTGLKSSAMKVWRMLTRDQRRSAVFLLGLTSFGAVLESLGLGLVVPVFAVMTQADLALRYPAIAPLLRALGDPTHEQLVLGGLATLAGAYTAKAMYLSLVAWRQGDFVFGFQASLSQRMFLGYLRQPWIFHLQRNSAEMIRNAVTEVHMFVFTVLLPGITLITETITLVLIGALLVVVEPFGTVLGGTVFGVIGWGVHRMMRTRMLQWGEGRVQHEGLKIKYLQEGLGGAKDVKLLGREADFLCLACITMAVRITTAYITHFSPCLGCGWRFSLSVDWSPLPW